MTRVALLGTGLLGSGFAEGLLARGGTELTVWNRTRTRAEPLADAGARVAATPAEAVAGAERVHLILLDDATVDDAIAALRPGLASAAVIVDHTTTQPARTAERARRLAAERVAYLHAPVFMSPAAARAAQGMMLIAGPAASFERVRDGLATMTGTLWYVGERADLAAAYKLFGNAMLLAITGALADVFNLADALDVPRGQAFELFDRLKLDPGMHMRGKKVVAGDYSASFTLETARKDLRLMLESADGQPLPLLSALAARMDEAIARGAAELDMAALAKPGV